jgi:hypothetical protein
VNILRFLQQVDRRFLYALLILVVGLPFFLNFQIPVTPSPSTEKMYTLIESLPEGSFVLFGVDWGAGTRGESRAQTYALMRHVMRKKLRFAIMAIGEPQSPKLVGDIARELQAEYNRQNTDYQYEEGVNWVNFGYKVDPDNFLKAWVKDIPSTIKMDVRGKEIATMPVLKGVKTAKDIKLLIDVAPSGAYESYIKFVQGPYSLDMGLACTSVMGPEAYNRLDAGQIKGLVVGLLGSVEYEALIKKPDSATRASNSSSAAHILIITFIILGNVAMVLERRQRARTGGVA